MEPFPLWPALKFYVILSAFALLFMPVVCSNMCKAEIERIEMQKWCLQCKRLG